MLKEGYFWIVVFALMIIEFAIEFKREKINDLYKQLIESEKEINDLKDENRELRKKLGES